MEWWEIEILERWNDGIMGLPETQYSSIPLFHYSSLLLLCR